MGIAAGHRASRAENRLGLVLLAVAVVAALLAADTYRAPPAHAATVEQSGFELEPVFGGTTVVGPASIVFAPAPDTRVFIAERQGRVLVFDSIYDSSPSTVLNIESDVHGFWDRGLLGIEVDPNWNNNGWLYLLYTLDTGNEWDPLDGGTAGKWGSSCPDPPGATDDGCVVDGELIRVKVNASSVVTNQQALLTRFWCQQYPSHSIGDLGFGADGFLYVSAGDGANFNIVDYGQHGGDNQAGNRTPNNPCLDPDPTPGGTNPPFQPNPALTLPDAEGGALRSQDLLTLGDPLSYDGSILRIDKTTGAAAPGNPLSGGDKARVIAHGLRNPYRFTIRPGTNEVWIGDVGWGTWEEINKIPSPGGTVENFGWPCYEGAGRQDGYDGADLDLCESLYADAGFGGNSTYTAPFYAYGHGSNKPDSSGCPGGGASVSGLAFPQSTTYPSSYTDALVFGDFSYACTWTMFGSGGEPDPSNIQTLISGLGIVDLTNGPGGELYISEFTGGNAAFWRLTYPSGNSDPIADLEPSTTSGIEPLTVDLDASGSTDPDNDHLQYAWDLDNDGQFDDATGPAAQTILTDGSHTVRLRVRDFYGDQDIDTATIVVSSEQNEAPTANVSASPTSGEAPLTVNFDGSGSSDPDAGDGLTFAWDLDDDGQFDDATGSNAQHTFTTGGDHRVILRVTDDGSPNLSDTASVTISVTDGPNSAPNASINTPTGSTTWAVGDSISFRGTATDPEDGTLPASAFSWDILLRHCEALDDCHIHSVETIAGVRSGTITGPDHEYPSFLELVLTVTDSNSAQDTASVEVFPETVDLTVTTDPKGLEVTYIDAVHTAPHVAEVIVGSTSSVSTASPQQKKKTYVFRSWSDGGAQAHDVVAPPSSSTITAQFLHPRQLLMDVRDGLKALASDPPIGLSSIDRAAIQLALKRIKNALPQDRWIDGSTLDPLTGKPVLTKIKSAVDDLRTIGLSSPAYPQVQNSIWLLVADAEGLAFDAIESAKAEGFSTNAAESWYDRAQTSIRNGKPHFAAKRFKQAWIKATEHLL